MTIRYLLLATVAVVLGSCGDDASDSSAGPPPVTDTAATDTSTTDTSTTGTATTGDDTPGDIVDGAWDVVSLQLDGSTVQLIADWPVTMTIDGDRIGGTAACNSYGGAVVIDNGAGAFSVNDLAQTEMACLDDGVMEVESAFLTALAQVDSFVVGDDLVLSGDGVVVELNRQPEVVDAELAGTTWALDTVITGEDASNSPAMEGVFLEFADDGTLRGFTGCRDLAGDWQLDGERLQVLSLTALEPEPGFACPPEVVEIEQAVIATVESGTEIVIEGDRLTLTAPGGDGLSLRAM